MKRLLLIGLLIVGCEEPEIDGCMDHAACNYNVEATRDRVSCIYPEGCNEWCDGDSLSVQELDCASVCGGTGYFDNCGICVGGTTELTACNQDCEGEWGGSALINNCGFCSIDVEEDGSSPAWGCEQDCNGVWGGDGETVADGQIPEGEDCCEADSLADCAGICAGITEVDCAGICGGMAEVDCAGICAGSTYLDNCNVCDSDSSNDCPLYDIDGHEYEYVKIGNHVWMRENLKTIHYRNGDIISTGYDKEEWRELSTPAYAIYPAAGDDDSLSNFDKYGTLYNWYVVNDNRGICPEGWHVPEKDEWIYLNNYLEYEYPNTYPTGSMKECKVGECPSSDYWREPNDGATNQSDFTGLPGGFRRTNSNPDFDHIGGAGYFWSSTEENSSEAWSQALNYNNVQWDQFGYGSKSGGVSIRCIQD